MNLVDRSRWFLLFATSAQFEHVDLDRHPCPSKGRVSYGHVWLILGVWCLLFESDMVIVA